MFTSNLLYLFLYIPHPPTPPTDKPRLPPAPEWSHAFSEGVDLLMHRSAVLLTYHHQQALLRSWDTDTGHLLWETVLEETGRGGRYLGEEGRGGEGRRGEGGSSLGGEGGERREG